MRIIGNGGGNKEEGGGIEQVQVARESEKWGCFERSIIGYDDIAFGCKKVDM